MLTIETASHLNKGCKLSDSIYEQGGLIYKYTFGYHRAHSFIEERILSKAINPSFFESSEVNTISLFFESALVQPFPESISSSTLEFTEHILSLFKKDFTGMYSCISNYIDKDDSKELALTFIKDNDFHTVELFWSID